MHLDSLTSASVVKAVLVGVEDSDVIDVDLIFHAPIIPHSQAIARVSMDFFSVVSACEFPI